MQPENRETADAAESSPIPVWQRCVFGVLLPFAVLFGGLWLYAALAHVKMPEITGSALDFIILWWVFGFLAVVFEPLILVVVLYFAFRIEWKHWLAAFFGGLTAIVVGFLLGCLTIGVLKVMSD